MSWSIPVLLDRCRSLVSGSPGSAEPIAYDATVGSALDAVAAMIYQHATTAADHKIADALTRRIDRAQGTAATRPEEAPADGETAV
jgi:hypothetical protein